MEGTDQDLVYTRWRAAAHRDLQSRRHSCQARRSTDLAATQGKLLHLLARVQGARSVLEIGTLGGYSTIWLARALPPDGRLVSLEYDPA
ncbi:hypothetical protein PUR26_02090, partial [Streptomyces sp. SP18CS02]|nr:hypothetical protein [Streptomyces sp. SP18CS02]